MDNEEMERYAQHMEIQLDDMQLVVTALMKSGYQVLCLQDGESMDVVMIHYVRPKYTGHYFGEVEE